MGQEPRNPPGRKEVCRALTNLVKASPLRTAVDPKTFFMTVHAHFDVLQQEGTFNLGPLWDALVGPHRTENLAGLFLRFQSECEALGLQAILPAAVARLSEEAKTEARRLFEEAESEFTPLPEAFLDTVTAKTPPTKGFDPVAPPSRADAKIGASASRLDPRNPQAHRPEVRQRDRRATDSSAAARDAAPAGSLELREDELARATIAAVVQAVRSSPIASRVEPGALTYRLSESFHSLVRDHTFDMQALIGALREEDGVLDEDLCWVVALLEESLPALGLRAGTVDLDVDESTKERLRSEACRTLKQDRKDLVDGLKGGSPVGLVETEPRDAEGAPSKSSRKSVLGKTRRKSLHGSQARSGTRRTLRLLALVVPTVSIAAFAYLSRPNRPYDVGAFDAHIPLKSGRLVQGAFVGLLDEARWYAIPPAERQARLVEFEVAARRDRLLPNLQVRDAQGTLVITTGSQNRLMGAKQIMELERPLGDDAWQQTAAEQATPR